jgi:hypothetical protein
MSGQPCHLDLLAQVSLSTELPACDVEPFFEMGKKGFVPANCWCQAQFPLPQSKCLSANLSEKVQWTARVIKAVQKTLHDESKYPRSGLLLRR